MIRTDKIDLSVVNAKVLNELKRLFNPGRGGSEKWLKKQRELINLSEKLYRSLPLICWKTEKTLASELNVSVSRIRLAKAYLVVNEKIDIHLQTNKRRSNPKHVIHKKGTAARLSTKPVRRSPQIVWEVLTEMRLGDLNSRLIEELLDIYEEMNIPFIPIHYPTFEIKKGVEVVYCSCRSGRRCDAVGKHPKIRYSELDFSRRSTFRYVRRFWKEDNRYNIGFLTHGFTVIDIDFRKFGMRSFGYLQRCFGKVPETLVVETGNGLHYYTPDCSRSTTFSEFPGVDIKSNGSLVIAPGSIHKSGNQYKWACISKPEQMPLNLFKVIMGGISKQPICVGRSATPARLNAHSIGGIIPDGERNMTLFYLASRLRGNGKEFDEIYETLQLTNKRCAPPLPDARIYSITKSVMGYIPNCQKE